MWAGLAVLTLLFLSLSLLVGAAFSYFTFFEG